MRSCSVATARPPRGRPLRSCQPIPGPPAAGQPESIGIGPALRAVDSFSAGLQQRSQGPLSGPSAVNSRAYHAMRVVVCTGCLVTFLRARRRAQARPFWAALEADHAGAPSALQELARGDSSVVCDLAEAAAALAWARRVPGWHEDPAPVWIAGGFATSTCGSALQALSEDSRPPRPRAAGANSRFRRILAVPPLLARWLVCTDGPRHASRPAHRAVAAPR